MSCGRPPRALEAVLSPLLSLAIGGAASADTLRVPADLPTIQLAIDAADDGDTIRVAPDVYFENLVVSGKHVTLESDFVVTGDRADVDATVIDGGGGDFVLQLASAAGSEATLHGITLRNAEDGITPNNPITFVNGRITNTSDGIDFEDGSVGVILGSRFDGNADDGLDLDDKVSARIAGNRIVNNGQDGIEIRLQDFDGDPVEVIVEDNWIAGNAEDGIQLIDYGGLTARTFIIERNRFADNGAAALGMMCDKNTDENFEGCPIPEPVLLANNTFVRNDHGVTGGASVTALNNLFVDHTVLAIKNVSGESLVAYSLFWGNGQDVGNSSVDAGTTLNEDPLLLDTLELAEGSPAIDAGTASHEHGAFLFELDPSEFSGAAPDLGAIEFVPEPESLLLQVVSVACVALRAARSRSRAR
jgi:hypothetical protein